MILKALISPISFERSSTLSHNERPHSPAWNPRKRPGPLASELDEEPTGAALAGLGCRTCADQDDGRQDPRCSSGKGRRKGTLYEGNRRDAAGWPDRSSCPQHEGCSFPASPWNCVRRNTGARGSPPWARVP